MASRPIRVPKQNVEGAQTLSVNQNSAWGHRLNGGIAISCFDGAQCLNVSAVGASGDEAQQV
jgi:hypothetical protein